MASVSLLALSLVPAAHAAERGSELISPPDKNGAPVLNMLPASADGDAVVFTKQSSNPESAGAQTNVPTLARRTSTGWTLNDTTLPVRSFYRGQSIVVATNDAATRSVIASNVQLDPDEPRRPGDSDLYLHMFGEPFARLVNGEQGVDPAPFPGFSAEFRGGSSDLDTVVFERPGPARLLPEASESTVGLYRRRGGTLDLVSVMPDGSQPADQSVVTSPYRVNGSRGGGQQTHEVSNDGNRVFFSVDGALYVRDGGTRTLAVSASQRAGDGGAVRAATFIGASPSGDAVYFWSDEPLTDGTSGGGVYRYEIADGPGADLTRVTEDPGAGGLGLTSALTSGDGSTVYFVAAADLASGGTVGQPNVYVARGGEVRFIATAPDGATVERVSTDGGYAAISSTTALGSAELGGFRGLYVYAAASGALDCASCRADGSPNGADASVNVFPTTGVGQTSERARAITNDGRLFFATADRLVAADIGDANDVYVYEDGRPDLLTAGNADPSYLLDNTEDGRTVFVSTAERRVAQDVDSEYDLYALRTGGGFPVPPEPPACSGDGCRGPLTPELAPQQPTSTVSVPVTTGKRDGDSGTTRRLTVKRSSATSKRVTLRVTVPSAGSIRANGRAVRTARVVKTSANRTYTLRLALTSSTVKKLKRSGRVTFKVRVRFEPTAGKAVTKTVPVTVKSAKRPKKGGR